MSEVGNGGVLFSGIIGATSRELKRVFFGETAMLKRDDVRVRKSAYDYAGHMEECRSRGLGANPCEVSPASSEKVTLLACENVNLGDIKFGRTTQSRGHVLWTSADIKQRAINGFCLMLQESGVCAVDQGSSVTLQPGDLMLVDTACEARYRLEDECRQLWVDIPRSQLESAGLDWRKHAGRPVPPATSAFLADLLRSTFSGAENLGNSAKAALEASFLNVFVAMYVDAAACAHHARDGGGERGVFRNILDYLAENLDHPDLTPATIARQFAMSERQLHRIFQARDFTVCGWIRNARLQRCATELRDPTLPRRSVTEIAFSNGFNDCAHFSRLFKEVFDCSPRAYRQHAQDVASAKLAETQELLPARSRTH